MRYKGYDFKSRPDIVLLKKEDTSREGTYVRFGRIVPQKRIPGPDAEEARLVWSDTGARVYGYPIKMTGYSRTNMAYGADGNIYLCIDGRCYTHRLRSTVDEVLHWHEKHREACETIYALRKEIKALKAEQEAMI